EGLDGSRDVAVLPEDVTPEKPCRVIFRLQLDRDVVLPRGTRKVSLGERVARGPHRGFESVHAWKEAVRGLPREGHRSPSDSKRRKQLARPLWASSWSGFRASAWSYAESASPYRSSCWRAIPRPAQASAFRSPLSRA